jgi:mono/diheme cytochrome c family protein
MMFVAFITLMLVTASGITVRAQGGGARSATAGAAPAGNVEAGKGVWALGNTSCRNCHGSDGEGAFGPPLAGRFDLTYERFRDYVRSPVGRMPAYVESELTDQEIADLVAFFGSLSPAGKSSPWRIELPKDAPRGQQLAVSVIGCGQCHGATFSTPRHGMAEVNGDFEWFKRMVYTHTQAQREQWSQLDPALPRVTPAPAGPSGRNRIRMGNYSRQRLSESLLKEIYDWARDLGPLATLTGRLAAAPAATSGGSTYTVTVINTAVKNKGLTAEDVTVAVELPDNVQVVNATGAGYEGVRRNGEGRNVALWRIPRLAAADQQSFTITLSGAAPMLRGTIRWARPAVKADGQVNFALPGAGRGAA